MEKNIIRQMYCDENSIKYNSVIDYSQMINKIKFNNMNNEIGENSFYNREDIRLITEEKYFSPNELGFKIIGKPYLRIGACNRQIALKLFGAISEDKDLNVYETIERNNLIKKQWEEKLKYCNLLIELPKPEIKNIFGLNIKSFEKYIIKDVLREKEYILMIKPVNDTSYMIKETIFTNKEIMNIHIPEILMNIFYFKKPVKLLYVGKNNTEIFEEHNIGIKDGYLVENGKEYDYFNINDLISDSLEMQQLIEENKIPNKSYLIDSILKIQEVSEMVKYKIINNKSGNSILNGEKYTSFQCTDCKYRKICEELGDGIFESENKK